MKKIMFMITVAILIIAYGCGPDKEPADSNKNLAQKQEQLMQEANRQVGMPAIKNFQMRKTLKMIQELCDQENIINYAYLWNEFNGKLVFLGKCEGYGIPCATEFTNPMKEVIHEGSYNGGNTVIPQADPNGLFMPSSAEGTWLMLLDKKGEPHPVYIEPRVIVSPFELQ